MKLNYKWIWALLLSTTILGCSQADTSNQTEAAQETTTATADKAKKETIKTILFFGNSLTAGYGLEPSQAFPALIQERIDSLDLPYRVVNAGVSGETTAGGKSRIDWLLKKPVDVFVLELGANDGLRGIDPESTYNNLKTIMEKVRDKNPEVQIILAGMQLPPSMGQKYTKEFSEVYTRLAKEQNVHLIPFLLEGVGGDPKLNQADGIHPTTEGQKILANNVWNVLEKVVSAPVNP
ncbi:arylesterase [Pontibacter sp. H259]|uniref:arylesterase n=1 Tax=Pontibacter sp. H259 TaxID=3133421 RepID=UPI0030BBECBF